MRIVGGNMRGLVLAELGAGDAAAHLRPTSDRLRETVFNLLLNGKFGNVVAGARVLDLFAGTGALGLEALSRGASHVTFVDNGDKSQGLIAANIGRARASDCSKLLRRDACRLGAWEAAAHDLVFLDPPYQQGLGERAVRAALDGGWIEPAALIVWEEARPPVIPAGLTLLDQRQSGKSLLSILRAA